MKNLTGHPKLALSGNDCRRFRSKILAFMLMALLILPFSNGCVTALNETPDKSDGADAHKKSTNTVNPDSESKLIKPSIPEEMAQSKNLDDRQKTDSGRGIQTLSGEKQKAKDSRGEPASPTSSADKSGESSKKRVPKPVKIREIDKVKNAALEMGQNMSSVEKIKICFMKSTDEYWVTFYDDIGALIDLKQYIWEAESESLTPFLVLKRIPKSRLETHMNISEPEKECQVIENSGRKKQANETEGDSKSKDDPKR